MNLYSKIILVATFFCGIFFEAGAQTWIPETESNVRSVGERQIIPNKFVLARVDDNELKQALALAPMEDGRRNGGGATLSVMLASGDMDEFEVVEYAMMEPELAAKFPEFKTYIGVSRSNPFRKIRIDHTQEGFRAVIADEKGRTYIDPYQKGDSNTRIIYKKKDIVFDEDWTCEVKSSHEMNEEVTESRLLGDCQLREYRIAVAATGEYTVFHGGQQADGLAAIVTAMNRVNQIFEQDLAVRMVLIGNNDLIVYTDGSNDPYTNGNAGVLLGQNQTNVDNVIGTNNYDIGHIFSTGDNAGVAILRSLCYFSTLPNDQRKAQGVTGLINPINDPFYIDFVAHEIGHQFGGNHTQNNSCQRNSATAVEPGSASTIMGYAGICFPNVQNNSDAYFHAISMAEMTNHVTGAANSCAVISNTNTSPPVVSALQDYTVPRSTSLVLEAQAMDADVGDALTYCWEQTDNQVAPMPPQATNTGGPAFRSIYPSASGKRYLPNINAIINNQTPEWEVLPSVSRTMNWRVTVRDHLISVGCTDETDMEITVDGNSGPFLVLDNSVPAQVSEGQSITLQWDVAGTDVAPVSCDNVDIFLSTDGGLTYPTTLISATDNDGSEAIVIPAVLTTTARIMVKCSDNIFFDINNSNFEIEEGQEGFVLEVNPLEGESCNDDVINFTVNSSAIMGFNDPINLSITGLPAGANASFSTNPIVPGASSIVSLSNFGSNVGTFNLDIMGESGAIVNGRTYGLTLVTPVLPPALSSPVDNAVDLSTSVNLNWSVVTGASSYDYEVSINSSGGSDVASGNVSAASVLVNGLDSDQTYYWRVRSNNSCGNSVWSAIRNFTTSDCTFYPALDLPLAINDGIITSSTINVDQQGIISEISVVNMEIAHTYFWDLDGLLLGPDATSVELFKQECDGPTEIFEFSVADDGLSNFPCPPNGASVQPIDALSAFNGKEMNGAWSFRVADRFRGDSGSLSSWGLKICTDVLCDLTVDSDSQTGDGTLLDAIECASAGDIITLASSLANQSINLGNMQVIIDKNLTIQADPADNITISYSGSGNAMEVKANATATLQGITFVQN